MKARDIKIDFKNKVLSFRPKVKGKFAPRELYSALMDLFDEPENMKYDIPVLAKSKTEFELINGWKLESASRKYLSGHISQG